MTSHKKLFLFWMQPLKTSSLIFQHSIMLIIHSCSNYRNVAFSKKKKEKKAINKVKDETEVTAFLVGAVEKEKVS